MAFDAVQMLRQTYAHGADAARMMEIAAGKDAADAVQPETGKVNGMSFAVEVDPMAELMDSMEELSLQFEEKAQKKVSQRRMGEMQGPRMNYLKAVEVWQSTFPDMPGPEFLARLLRNARQAIEQGRGTDVQEFLKELARGSTDPSHQYAMLDILMKGCGESEKALFSLLQDAQAQLERTHGPEIRAGLNIAQEINSRATSGEEMQAMRDMYRGEVMGFTSPQACFRALLASGGAAGLKSAIEFLIAGCGADMASVRPSMDPAVLGRILTDLQCLDVLQTVLDDLTALAARMTAQFGESCQLGGVQLADRVLDMTEQSFVPPAVIAALISDCGIARLLAQMDFSRELIRLFRRLSPRLFARESARQQLVDSAQEHLDGLVMREVEEEDEDREETA